MAQARAKQAVAEFMVRWVLLLAGGFAVFGGSLELASGIDDYRLASSLPLERAVVIRVAQIDPGGKHRCPTERVSWKVAAPRPGLPAGFSTEAACRPPAVGDTATVVRTDAGDGPHVTFDPPLTVVSILYGAARTAGVCGAAALLPIAFWWVILRLSGVRVPVWPRSRIRHSPN